MHVCEAMAYGCSPDPASLHRVPPFPWPDRCKAGFHFYNGCAAVRSLPYSDHPDKSRLLSPLQPVRTPASGA